MRLIDADNLKKVMAEDWFLEILASQNSKDGCKKVIKNCIDSIPLDYDIKEVVAELKEWTFNADVNIGDGTLKNSDLIASKNAIDIVKRGEK